MSSREDWRRMFFGVPCSVTCCKQELGTPKNMAADLPGMTLHPLYTTFTSMWLALKWSPLSTVAYQNHARFSTMKATSVEPEILYEGNRAVQTVLICI